MPELILVASAWACVCVRVGHLHIKWKQNVDPRFATRVVFVVTTQVVASDSSYQHSRRHSHTQHTALRHGRNTSSLYNTRCSPWPATKKPNATTHAHAHAHKSNALTPCYRWRRWLPAGSSGSWAGPTSLPAGPPCALPWRSQRRAPGGRWTAGVRRSPQRTGG